MLSGKLSNYQSNNDLEGLSLILDELNNFDLSHKSQIYIDNIHYICDLIKRGVNDDDMGILDEAIEILFNLDL